ncbi:unnamed protein product [Soboliphyme baturini]|uniref:SAM domain-containing protein n=1 Tax=Soboliphyme baturini TaxID=241478 RepID=A0A183IQ51_9BILA|nr:unnamed protein product [Soboliphyme baturini]
MLMNPIGCFSPDAAKRSGNLGSPNVSGWSAGKENKYSFEGQSERSSSFVASMSEDNSRKNSVSIAQHAPSDCVFANNVPLWLKTLRLHKYAHLFSKLTYDEMMMLNEEMLEDQVCSLPDLLGSCETLSLSSSGHEVDDENIPAHFTRVLGKCNFVAFAWVFSV